MRCFHRPYLEVLVRVDGQLGAVHVQAAETLHGCDGTKCQMKSKNPFDSPVDFLCLCLCVFVCV